MAAPGYVCRRFNRELIARFQSRTVGEADKEHYWKNPRWPVKHRPSYAVGHDTERIPMKALYLTAALALVAAPAFAQTKPATPSDAAAGTAAMEVSARQFVAKAAVGNLFEVETSKLATAKSQSPDVKKFAQMMIEDHTKAGSELKALVGKGDTGQLAVPTKLDRPHAQKLEQLEAAAGSEFDQSYKQMQLEAHREAVALFSSYAQTGDNAELKQWAGKTLPTLQKHFQEVQDLQISTRTGGLQQ
jgi:putative membrane protein